MPRSTAHALLSSLADIGLLAHTSGLRYRLGWRLLTLSGRLLTSTDVARRGAPVLARLAGQLRRTVRIATYDNGQVVAISQAGPGGAVAGLGLGERLPAHSTACGKIMLAYLGIDPGTLGLSRLTRKTVTDPERLRAALAEVRRNDLAFDRQETDDALTCVASSNRDARTDTVIAALSLCLPPRELDRDINGYTRCLRQAARQICTNR
jgi:DNA-binding IclR family transcriptional regulator